MQHAAGTADVADGKLARIVLDQLTKIYSELPALFFL
jgi:hypothetical protein